MAYIAGHSKPLRAIFAHYAGLNLTSSPNHGVKWEDMNRAAHELELEEFQAYAREFKLLQMVSHSELANIYRDCKADHTTRAASFDEFRDMLAQVAVHAFGDFPQMRSQDCACALIQHMDKQAVVLNNIGIKRIMPLVGLRGRRSSLR